MSREVRRVPPDWNHPREDSGRWKPLFNTGYAKKASEFLKTANQKSLEDAMEESDGFVPRIADYMPEWDHGEATHYMMYETVSEGTPISPAFATPEELARWCADTEANAGAGRTASYDAWLKVAKGACAPSMVFSSKHGLVSGVEFLECDQDILPEN